MSEEKGSLHDPSIGSSITPTDRRATREATGASAESNASDRPVLAVDLGGTSVKTALVDSHGRVLSSRRVPTPGSGRGAVIEAIRQEVRSIATEVEAVWPVVGVGSPGMVDDQGYLHEAAVNIPGWSDFHLARELESALEMPVVALNDANAAAMGEYKHGAGSGNYAAAGSVADSVLGEAAAGSENRGAGEAPGASQTPGAAEAPGLGTDPGAREATSHAGEEGAAASSLALVTVGTGIGVGLVVAGSPYAGAHGAAGELGHLVIRPGGRRCACGNRGCVEAYASAAGVASQTREFSERFSDAESPLAAWVRSESTSEAPSLEHIYRYLPEGDPLAAAVHEQVCEALAQLCAVIATALAPDRIVFSGGGMGAAGHILPVIRERLPEYVLTHVYRSTALSVATVGADAGLIGAAAAARRYRR